MSAELLPMLARAGDSNNDPLNGAKWYFYATGGLTPQAVYTTSALSTPHANPVVADSAGKFAPIYLDASLIYRGILKSAAGTTIFDFDPINSSVIAQLSGDEGGDLVTTRANLASGAVTRTMNEKLGDLIDIRDTGAVGLNGTGDAAAIDTLLNQALPGQTIRGLRGGTAAASFRKTGSAFQLTRQVDFDFEQGIDLWCDNETGDEFNALEIDVQLTAGDGSPTTTGEYGNGWLRGGRISTYNITTDDVDTLGGGYGIRAGNEAGKSIIGLTIEKMNIGGGLAAVLFDSDPDDGRELQWCQIVRSRITNGVIFSAEDGEIAVDCVVGGENPAYTFDMTYGAFCAGVFRGAVGNVGGAVDLVNGSMVKLHDVQMEHRDAEVATGLANGAQVIARGNDYHGLGNELIGCNLGSGPSIDNTVVLYNQRTFRLYRNQFRPAGASADSPDLLLVNNNGDSTKDTYDTIVGYDHTFWGTRAIQGFGSITDVTRRMVVAVALSTGGSGTLRQPHRGLWFPLFAQLTSTAVGLTDGNLEAMIEHSGRIALQGKLTRAGFFGNAVAVGTLPAWLKPHRDQYILVHGEAGEVASMLINATTGVMTIAGTGLAASTSLIIPSGSWHVLLQRAYINPEDEAP